MEGMGGIIWLIIIGALFYWMMSRGCGGHRHGSGQGRKHGSGSEKGHDEKAEKKGGCH